MNRQDQFWIWRIILYFLPQALDVYGQRIIGDKLPCRVPELVQQPFPCDDCFGIADEHQKKAVLQGGKRNLRAVFFYNTCFVFRNRIYFSYNFFSALLHNK